MTTRPRAPHLIRPLVLALALAGVPAVTLAFASASASAAAAATCATITAHWGSLNRAPTASHDMTPASITNVRAGRHACFDRMVIDLTSNGASYMVRYVSHVLTEGQGAIFPLRGGARLSVVLMVPTYDINTGRSTYNPANDRELANVAGFSTFRQIASGGSFEGYTTFGLGVRARLPMRAFIVGGPGAGSRLIIDVAHHW